MGLVQSGAFLVLMLPLLTFGDTSWCERQRQELQSTRRHYCIPLSPERRHATKRRAAPGEVPVTTKARMALPASSSFTQIGVIYPVQKKVKCWLRTVATRNTWRRRGGSKRQAAKAKFATGPTDEINKRVELKETLHSRRKLKRRSTQHRRYSMPVANVEAGGGSTCVACARRCGGGMPMPAT